jgi:hypothetical protein
MAQPPGGYNSKIPISFARIRYLAGKDEQTAAN